MTPTARIVNRLTTSLLANDAEGIREFTEHRNRIPGWSLFIHYAFFRAVLAELFTPPDRVPAVLVCGVYHGLDLALIAALARRHHPGRPFDLTGVDLFSSEPCADWPEEKRGLSWEAAFGCPPPSVDAARRNCPDAEVVQSNSVPYLREHAGRFDCIYLDTSHDEATVREELAATARSGRPGQLLTGDDYGTIGGFVGGVERAVTACLPHHLALFNRIWIAQG